VIFNHPYNGVFNKQVASGVIWPSEEVVAPLEPLTAPQLIAQMGFGHPILVRLWNTLNGNASPLMPEIGASGFAASAGALSVAGSIDSYDRAVATTGNAQADGQWSMGNGVLNPGNNPFAFIHAVEFLSSAGAANRNWMGHDSASDFIHQLMATTNQVRVATQGTVGSANNTLNIDHFTNGGIHVFVSTFMPQTGVDEMGLASELGTVTPTDISGLGAMDFAGAVYIFRNGATAHARVHNIGMLHSDGSSEMNDAMLEIHENRLEIAQNLHTAWGL
jgi:hypothetical protein